MSAALTIYRSVSGLRRMGELSITSYVKKYLDKDALTVFPIFSDFISIIRNRGVFSFSSHSLAADF